MSGIHVRGWGAVTPAGWGFPALLDALDRNVPLPSTVLNGPAGRPVGPVRAVPAPAGRPAFLGHPRLRRASAITQFAVAAACEALQGAGISDPGQRRLGIVLGTQTAPIRYSERFYGEVLRDPATASPILFPETVINAPASHLAAFLGGSPHAYTVIGDQTAFVQALLVAADWLLDDTVDVGLVVGAEELAWPVTEAMRLFSRDRLPAEGAGALVLLREPGNGAPPQPEQLTDAYGYAGQPTRLAAARAMRAACPPGTPDELLVDSRCGTSRVDRAETVAWADWPGRRWSPRAVLGEALSASTAWQFVAACQALAAGPTAAATVSVVGSNQQAFGARLTRPPLLTQSA